MRFDFVKGHGTHNDFVVLPDLDGSMFDDLDSTLVAAICDRRGGIGADGVLRVLTSSGDAPFFMDYRNADGSDSEMCGNGMRVFARFLADEGLVDPSLPLAVDTRDGVKHVTFCPDGEISVDLGFPRVGEPVKVSVEGREFAAQAVDTGNPHAVALVDTAEQLAGLSAEPEHVASDFPHGVNVEFVWRQRSQPAEARMRVFERGVGETASCGTGACAVAAVLASYDGEEAPDAYTIAVPGGVLTVRLDERGHAHLKGSAVLVARGTWLG
ncbi:MAG: diaminopimelate epimerase [Nocardioidaceae bacterium]